MMTNLTRRTFMATTLAAMSAAHRLSAREAVKPGGKKGCCLSAEPPQKLRKRLQLLRPAWLYTWRADRPAELPTGVDFTPMLWGDLSADKFDQQLENFKARIASGEIKNLLTFNEPDQKKQSNMTVERVVELWPRLMELNVPLISPGCVHPDRDWMRAFMEQAEQKNLRVDAIAVHSYGGPGVESLVKRLTDVQREFGRPLWITEFAVGDWEAATPQANRHSPARIAAFMKEMLPALDELSFVERYAWFSAAPSSAPLGTSALFGEQGELTKLGEIYASHA